MFGGGEVAPVEIANRLAQRCHQRNRILDIQSVIILSPDGGNGKTERMCPAPRRRVLCFNHPAGKLKAAERTP